MTDECMLHSTFFLFISSSLSFGLTYSRPELKDGLWDPLVVVFGIMNPPCVNRLGWFRAHRIRTKAKGQEESLRGDSR